MTTFLIAEIDVARKVHTSKASSRNLYYVKYYAHAQSCYVTLAVLASMIARYCQDHVNNIGTFVWF